jgi:hypothetical protein
VRLEVGVPFVGVWPARVVQQDLPSELVGHPEAFGRAEPGDTFAAVGVFGAARARPVAADELSDASPALPLHAILCQSPQAVTADSLEAPPDVGP